MNAFNEFKVNSFKSGKLRPLLSPLWSKKLCEFDGNFSGNSPQVAWLVYGWAKMEGRASWPPWPFPLLSVPLLLTPPTEMLGSVQAATREIVWEKTLWMRAWRDGEAYLFWKLHIWSTLCVPTNFSLLSRSPQHTSFCSVTRCGCCCSQLSGKVLSPNYSGFLFFLPWSNQWWENMCVFLFSRVRAGWGVKFLTIQFNPNDRITKVNANRGLRIREIM